MSGIDYKHVSILWAAPEHAEELAKLHAGLFEKPVGRRGLSRSCSTTPARPPSWRASARRRRLWASSWASSPPTRRKSSRSACGKDSQRHGIGRRLVEALARAAKKAEARRLFLEVAAGQHRRRSALYKKLGFQEVGRRKGYYQRAGAPPEDALTLALDALKPHAPRCGVPAPHL